jgi:signal transduction histidine kinase
VLTNRFFASTSIRLAILHAGLLTLAFCATAIIAWWATRDAAREELQQRIATEVAALSDEFRAEGLEAVVLAIETRSGRPGSLDYGLVDGAGRVRFAELPATRAGWSELELPEVEEPDEAGEEGSEERDEVERLLVQTVQLGDGSLLAVGEDLAREERLRDLLFATMAWVGLTCLLAGLAASVWLTRRSLRQVDQLMAISRAVSAGDLGARASFEPSAGRNDLDELSASFNAMLDRVQSLIANVREVSTDVAHDLRTPLSHVRQQLERARAAGGDPAAREAAIEAADVRLSEVLRTFDAMLRVAELDASPGVARLASVDLAELTERVADAFRPDIEAGGRQLIVQTAPAPATVDKDLIAQALANLLDNAIRHTPPGATIVVRTFKDSRAHLSVADNGPGIPADEREAVLKRFYRLERSRGGPGAGIGLSIVAAVARLHAAELVLEDARPGLRVSLSFS